MLKLFILLPEIAKRVNKVLLLFDLVEQSLSFYFEHIFELLYLIFVFLFEILYLYLVSLLQNR